MIIVSHIPPPHASSLEHALPDVLSASGVIMGALDARTVRAVTHLDVGAEDIATALEVLQTTLAAA